MSSRMDKYNLDSLNSVGSRTEKNSDLYKELSTNGLSSNVKNIDNNNNIVEITDFGSEQVNIRHRNSKPNIDFDTSESNNNFYDNIFGDDPKNKVYDVNDVLDIAKKNRTEEDEIEKQKRLKSIEYSILSDLNKDKIKEYHEKKEKGITKEEADNLEELINTITSNKLRQNIDNELFGDLMPSDPEETVISSNLLDELKEERLAKQENLDIDEKVLEDVSENDDEDDDGKIDKSFYTRSMDLKREDLVFDDDDNDSDVLDDSFKEGSTNVFKIILIIILTLVLLAIVGYCVYSFVK